MIRIENNLTEYNAELPKWWSAGQHVRIIPKGENSFFIYKNNDTRVAKSVIDDNNQLKLKTPDGLYDVLIHSNVCVRIIFNRGIDVDPEQDIPPEDIDPRTCSVYDLNYWFFRQAQSALKNKTIPKGFADAVKVMENAYTNMRLERKGLTQRKMETREIIVEDDDDED